MLLGGSSLIPKVQQIAKLYFDGKEPMTKAIIVKHNFPWDENPGTHVFDSSLIDPVEAVARGAAKHGSDRKIMSWRSETREVNFFPEVTCLTLGVETGGGFLTTVIKRGTVLPTKKSILMPMDHDW